MQTKNDGGKKAEDKPPAPTGLTLEQQRENGPKGEENLTDEDVAQQQPIAAKPPQDTKKSPAAPIQATLAPVDEDW